MFKPVTIIVQRSLTYEIELTADVSDWPILIGLLAYSIWLPISKTVYNIQGA